MAEGEWEEMTDSGEQVPVWEPKKGEVIQGILVKKRGNIGQYKSNIYIIEQLGGEKIGIWGSIIIDGHFDSLPFGTEVKIKYLGKVRGERGNDYRNYRVWKKRQAQEEPPEPVEET